MNMSVPDADIIALIRSNPDRGFRLMVSQYSERIYWHIRRIVNSHQDAEDVTQDTFLRIFRSIGSLNEGNALRGWIYRIATNEALRHLEKNGGAYLPLEDAAGLATDSYMDYSDIEAVQLKKAIGTLPPRQRVVFNLRYYDGLEYEEIASVLATGVHNVRANYHNAKAHIVKCMKSWNISMSY